ncbi:MAG TPA: copper resistance CopC family protein [Steroidobacteraceae bacterium]|nr:copper resistance CopC family protein [Steroidobacteraceae bacterium]
MNSQFDPLQDAFRGEAAMKLSSVTMTLAACLIVDTAQAHAHLEKSVPADGSTLRAAPAAVEMAFSEAAQLTALWLQKDQEPKQAIKELPTGANRTQRVALPTLAPGAYTLTWRVVAADGHVSSGAVHFTISPKRAMSAYSGH